MIRKLNYTGRKKLKRSRINITVRQNNYGQSVFDANLALEGLGLPIAACVYVEVYHRASYMRFDYGTVGKIEIPENRILTRIPVANPLFRVKIVDRSSDYGKILATADKIRPIICDEDRSQGISLLPVEYVDLGHRVWRLDIEGDWPVLELNKKIEGIRESVRSDPEFMTLVFPEILRMILHNSVVLGDYTDPYCDDEDWQTLWLRFALSQPNINLPPSGQSESIIADKTDWVDSVVDAFCATSNVLDKVKHLLAERSG